MLFATHQFFPEHRAGTEVLTLGLARALLTRGHEAAVFAAKRSIPFSDLSPYVTEDYAVGGVPVRRVGRPREGLSRPLRLGYDDPRMAEGFTLYLEEFRPDVVHFTHLQGITSSAVSAAKERGLPAVYTATDFWSLCPVVDLKRHDGRLCGGPDLAHCPRCMASRAADATGSRAARLASMTPGPVWRAAGAISDAPLPLWRVALPLRQVRDIRDRSGLVRERVNALDLVISPTLLTRDLLVANGVDPGIVRVSPYGVDVAGPAIPLRNTPPEPIRFGFIGTLGPHKGCDVLIRAFKKLPRESNATLDIHGGDAGFEEFGSLLRRLARDDARITFAGTFAPEDLGTVLSGMDVLVVPSRWYENAPLVVRSALAVGVPVIATNVGGLSEAITPGKNGLLFPLGSVDGLGSAVARILEEPALIDRLRDGIGPVKTVDEDAEELLGLYNDLVERPTDIGSKGGGV